MMYGKAAERLIATLNENRRLHISTHPALEITERDGKRLLEAAIVSGKPPGFWYGIDGSWMEWCISESEGWLRPYIYEVVISDPARIKQINTLEEFDAFENEYYSSRDALLDILTPQYRPPYNMRMSRMFGEINWSNVADKFGGIEIAPYQWKRRLESKWYYGWDCASGIVWEPGLATLKLFASYDEGKDEFIRC